MNHGIPLPWSILLYDTLLGSWKFSLWSAVQFMLRPFFTLPYCIAGCFCWVEEAQEGHQNECFTFRGATVIG